jgi:hypothetical protein
MDVKNLENLREEIGIERRMNRPYDRARECWKRIEEEDGRAAGRARLLSFGSK